MIVLPCPWCGPRNAQEFAHLGEVSARPAVDGVSRQQWRAYLYVRVNPCGWVRENWYHRAGCRRFFTVERHTLTNEVRAAAASAGAGETAPGGGDAGAPDAGAGGVGGDAGAPDAASGAGG